MSDSGKMATAEQVMGTCLRLELEAAALYKRFEEASRAAGLKHLWAAMAEDEMHHAMLVDRLASRRGFVPPAIGHDVLAAVANRVAAVRREADRGALDDERMLAIAAALEFSEMDDLFTAICQTAGAEPDRGRGDHLAPLVMAVVARPSSSGNVLQHLLAAMIRLHRRAGLGVVDTEVAVKSPPA
jgi:hypothetical protein